MIIYSFHNLLCAIIRTIAHEAILNIIHNTPFETEIRKK